MRDGCSLSRWQSLRTLGRSMNSPARRSMDHPVTHIQNRSLCREFIDGHIHFPKSSCLGLTKQLLDWLEICIFLRNQYANRYYAREPPGHFFETCLPGDYHLSVYDKHPVSTEVSLPRSEGRGFAPFPGLTGIDRFRTRRLCITPEDFLPRKQATDPILPTP